MEWVKFESQMRWFDEFLPPDSNVFPRAFDLLIVDEAHSMATTYVSSQCRRQRPSVSHRRGMTGGHEQGA